MKYVNMSGSRLVLPGERPVINKATVDLTDEDLKNRAIKSWIDSGLLVKSTDKEADAKFADPVGEKPKEPAKK